MDDESHIEAILRRALTQMERQRATAIMRAQQAAAELKSAEEALAAAEAHIVHLKAMVADPYCLGAAEPETRLLTHEERAAAQPEAPRPLPELIVEAAAKSAYVPFEDREPPRVPIVPVGTMDGRRAHALSPEQLQERKDQVLAALAKLWERGGRVVSADVRAQTGMSQDVAYRTINELAKDGEIILVKEIIRQGSHQTCNAIKPKGWTPDVAAPIVEVTPALATAAIKAAREVRKDGTDHSQRVLAGTAIRQAPLNTLARDVAEAVGVDAMNLTPGAVRQAGITWGEIDVTTAILRERVSFEELAPQQCQWEVSGSTEISAYRFCGRRRAGDDTKYCASHEWDGHHRARSEEEAA